MALLCSKPSNGSHLIKRKTEGLQWPERPYGIWLLHLFVLTSYSPVIAVAQTSGRGFETYFGEEPIELDDRLVVRNGSEVSEWWRLLR